ncbi:hypothetical protein GQ53DRAFT_840709 [Thozetella sp. PMI_491]|nr:hypothetical protein GQ53DRAFT_840709 [Thozetella sp. PMI_491]
MSTTIDPFRLVMAMFNAVRELARRRCAICHTTDGTLIPCGQCNGIYYCSDECKERDENDMAGDFADSKRPDPNKKRAIFFPNDGEKPEFRWVDLEEVDDVLQPRSDQFMALLGAPSTELRLMQLNTANKNDPVSFAWGDLPLIHLWFRNQTPGDFLAPNKSIYQCFDFNTHPKMHPVLTQWAGPVVAYLEHSDMNMDDFGRTLDHMFHLGDRLHTIKGRGISMNYYGGENFRFVNEI